MYTLCVSYIVREDANFVGIGGCFDNDGVRTCSPEKKGHSMSFSAEEKKMGKPLFRQKVRSWSWTFGRKFEGAKASSGKKKENQLQ